jgi:hypothetical protein
MYFINVFVANLGSTAGKFLIWKGGGGGEEVHGVWEAAFAKKNESNK